VLFSWTDGKQDGAPGMGVAVGSLNQLSISSRWTRIRWHMISHALTLVFSEIPTRNE